MGYNMFVGYGIGEKGQKRTKERSGASTSSPSRHGPHFSNCHSVRICRLDLPRRKNLDFHSVRICQGGQILPRTTNYQLSETNSCDRTTKLPAIVTIFYADLYWNNPWDCFPLIVSAADITGPTIKFDIFGKVQIESTLHLILTILFQSHNQSFYQLCKTSFILLRKKLLALFKFCRVVS